jgi:hypothetical protein
MGLLAAIAASATAPSSRAYTAAGDRSFPATILLPQIAPSDEFYATAITQPMSGGARETDFTAVYDKSITDRLGVFLTEGYGIIDPGSGPVTKGWQNTALAAQYTVIVDREHEFLLSAGVEREFGDTGAKRVGASSSRATQPGLTFGKGLGDLDIGYLRPLAISGFIGYQAADDTRLRDSQLMFGAAVEYSIPYLESKVAAVELPDAVRNLTPIVEFSLSAPTVGHDGNTVATIAPGLASTGGGWDFAIEALVPTTKSTGAVSVSRCRFICRLIISCRTPSANRSLDPTELAIALNHSEDTGSLLSFSRIVLAGLVQTNGLDDRLCSSI